MFKKVTQQSIGDQEWLNKLSISPKYVNLELTNMNVFNAKQAYEPVAEKGIFVAHCGILDHNIIQKPAAS